MKNISIIDFKYNTWDMKSISALSLYLMQNFGLQEDFNLYINTNDYDILAKYFNSNSQYYGGNIIPQNAQDPFSIYASNGIIYLYPTSQAEHCIFSDIPHKVYITNKRIEYKQDFKNLFK